MWTTIGRLFGTTRFARFGSVLMLAGLAILAYSLGAYVGILPGGYTSVPEPVALSAAGQRAARLGEATAVSTAPRPTPTVGVALPAPAIGAVNPTPTLIPATATPLPAVAIKLEPADAADRREEPLGPHPGLPVRLKLPTIKVDTEVQPGGLVEKDGELEWETLPFVATNYPRLGPVGAPGNPVVSGHVVTLREGNVFRDLYQVELGEPIEVYTADSHFTYRIDEIKLVSPNDVEVLEPTADARLTVITCGGTFDPRTRSFSDRLIVVGKLVGGERIG